MDFSFSPIVGFNLSTVFFTLINTLLVLFMYRKFMHDKVTAMLEKRKETIAGDIKAAEDAKISMQQKEAEYTALIADSKSEAEKIVSAATARAIEKEREILDEANKGAVALREKAEESIELEKKRVMNELKNQVSELVILTASAVAQKEINESDNKAIIENFLVNV
jgi:F-type H+-transporting ATPase subunit b